MMPFTAETAPTPVEAFISYAHLDEKLRQALDAHLALLKSHRLIDAWNDRCIKAGADWAREIDESLDRSRIILLLITMNFFNSGYCEGIELKRALAREKADEASVIPIIMSEGDYHGAPFAHLKELPTDGLAKGRSVTGRKWKNKDEAFRDVTEGIRLRIEQLQGRRLEQHAVRAYVEKGRRPPSTEDRQEIRLLGQSFGRVLAGRRVLWVDDHPENNIVERTALAELGVHIDACTNTDEAVGAVRSGNYDVVISDWTREPAEDKELGEGLRLLRLMRDGAPYTPLIFYTGWLSPEEMDRRKGLARSGGASGVTASPRELLRWTAGELMRSAALDPKAPFVDIPLYD